MDEQENPSDIIIKSIIDKIITNIIKINSEEINSTIATTHTQEDCKINQNIVYSQEDLHPTTASALETESENIVIDTAFEKEIESEMIVVAPWDLGPVSR